MNVKRIIDMIKAARKVSTPLICIATPDQQALVAAVVDEINGDTPKLSWDAVRGYQPLNDGGVKVLTALSKKTENRDIQQESGNPVAALEMASLLEKDTMVFAYNFHKWIAEDAVIQQGTMNLRDIYKQDRRTWFMLAPQWSVIPAEISSAVLFEEAMPDDESLRSVLGGIYRDAAEALAEKDPEASKFLAKGPTAEVSQNAVNAARGLPSFDAEQVFAMSLRKTGLDLDDTWERKIASVNQTKGITITRNTGFTFSDLGGQVAAQTLVRRVMEGNNVPQLFIQIEEIEKMMAGASSDSSGVSQDYLSMLLDWQQERKHDGIIAVGPPGSGKSAFAKAAGNTYGVPTVKLDLGAMKGSLVGESEQAIRNTLRVLDGVCGDDGHAFVIATCNKLGVVPPELRRRYKKGIYMFALPDDEEKAAIWKICLANFPSVDASQPKPNDRGWTGSEIANTVEGAWDLNITLIEAAAYILPVSQSDPESVLSLYNAANDRWFDAGKGGAFQANDHIDGLEVAKERWLKTDPGVDRVVRNIDLTEN